MALFGCIKLASTEGITDYPTLIELDLNSIEDFATMFASNPDIAIEESTENMMGGMSNANS